MTSPLLYGCHKRAVATRQRHRFSTGRDENASRRWCSKPVSLTESGAWNSICRIRAVFRVERPDKNSAKRRPNRRLVSGDSQLTSCWNARSISANPTYPGRRAVWRTTMGLSGSISPKDMTSPPSRRNGSGRFRRRSTTVRAKSTPTFRQTTSLTI